MTQKPSPLLTLDQVFPLLTADDEANISWAEFSEYSQMSEGFSRNTLLAAQRAKNLQSMVAWLRTRAAGLHPNGTGNQRRILGDAVDELERMLKEAPDAH